MNRIVRACGAVVLLLVLVVGVPVALIALAGWPLPSKIPDVGNMITMARQNNIQADFVTKSIALVVWLAWIQLLVAVVWEVVVNVPRLLSGRRHRRAPLVVAPVSNGVAKLFSMILTAGLLSTAVSQSAVALPNSHVDLSPDQSAQLLDRSSTSIETSSSTASGFGTAHGHARGSTQDVDARSADSRGVNDRAAKVQVAARWVAAADDSLWDIAEQALGDGSEVAVILQMNPGLDPSQTLHAGTEIRLPSGSQIPSSRTPSAGPVAAGQVGSDGGAPDGGARGGAALDGGAPGRDADLAGALSTAAPSNPVASEAGQRTSAPTYTVQANDGMWNVAEALLGDGTRHAELQELVVGQEVAPGVVFTNDTFVIHEGWVFTQPTTADDADAGAGGSSRTDGVTVVAGDTLSEIADRELGDPDAWPEIFDQNAGRQMSDGRTFDDPDLIVPGWQLDVPTSGSPSDDDTTVPAQVIDPHQVAVPDRDIAPDQHIDHDETSGVDGQHTDSDHDADGDQDTDSIQDTDSNADQDTDSDRSDDIASGPTSATPDAPAAPATPSPTSSPATSAPVASTPSTGAPAVGTPGSGAPAESVPASTTTVAAADAGSGNDIGDERNEEPSAPSPIRIEHAALLAAGILSLVGVRRRQRLRAASPRARVPEPAPSIVATERRLRTIDAGERSMRVDVAIRAAAHELVDVDAQIGTILVDHDGAIDIRLTAPAPLPAPWVPGGAEGRSWQLPAAVPIELLVESARRVGTPCVALVQLGVSDGSDLLVDVEACGTLAVDANPRQSTEVVTALATGLATSPYAEIAHLITHGLPEAVLVGHRNARRADSPLRAFDLGAELIGSVAAADRSTFSLRSLRTGGEMWEPAVVILGGTDTSLPSLPARLPLPGRGLALVAAIRGADLGDHGACLVGTSDGWRLDAFGTSIDLDPVGIDAAELDAVIELVDDASAPLEIDDELTWDSAPSLDHGQDHDHDHGHGHNSGEQPTSTGGQRTTGGGMVDLDGDLASALGAAESRTGAGTHNGDEPGVGHGSSVTSRQDDHDQDDHDQDDHSDHGHRHDHHDSESTVRPAAAAPFEPRPHEIVVRLMGPVSVDSRDGRPGTFERSKTVELIAWLATHRQSSTRTAARTALWELDVRDATFANVVSEARRALGRLVTPPGDDEWVARTLTEQLPLHAGVVTDAQLIADRLDAARLQPPAQAIDTLRPAAELIRDIPFAGTSYLWPDAEGIASNLVLLATSVSTELAGHALSLGDIDLVFWATGQGLQVLPGHEELIGIRMQAHARAGDLAGVRQEWESYERVIVADAWSDGEPAPKLLALRHELLTAPA